jgi:periplasmic protein TonB
MAYADQKMSSGRVTAIVIVVLLHVLLGYAFISGLAYNVVKNVAKDLKTFDVTEEPPPPEEEPPPPPETPQQVQPPPVVSPPPIVRTNTPPPPVTAVNTAPPAPITYTAPPAPPAPVSAPPPPPPPPRVVQTAKAKGDLRTLFSLDDYPSAAQRNEEEGTVRVRLTVGANGRVSDCSVTQSSGSSSLDQATCRIIRSRARFTPAVGNDGAATTDTVNSPPITWKLQDE